MMKIINILLTSLLIIGVLPLKVDNSKKMNLYDIKINSLEHEKNFEEIPK